MAEPNYVEQINRQRQQSRVARRERGSEIIDPLESQAVMDRMTGTTVSPIRSAPIDASSSPIVATAGGGRSGVPVHTAGFLFPRGGEHTVVSSPTVVTGGCANGKCGVPQGGVISSYPSSPVVTSYPMGEAVVSGAPMGGTVVSGSPVSGFASETLAVPSTGDGTDHLQAIRQFAVDKAGPKYGGVAAAQIMSNAEGRSKFDAQTKAIQEENQKKRDFFQPKIDADVKATLADAEHKQSEAKVNLATAQLAHEASGLGGAATEDKLLDQVIGGTLNPETYIANAIKMQSARGATDSKGAMTVAEQRLPDAQYKQIRRQAYGAIGIGIALRQQAAHDAAQNALPGAVGKDPVTGQPVTSGEGDPTALKRASSVNNIAIEGIISGYHESGILGGSWHSVKTALMNDVWHPLEESTTKMFRAKHADTLAGMSPDARAKAEVSLDASAQQYASTVYNYIEARLAKANAELGGGTPDNPKGGMWSQMKQAVGAAPSAWGSAPAMPTPSAPPPAQPSSESFVPPRNSYWHERAE